MTEQLASPIQHPDTGVHDGLHPPESLEYVVDTALYSSDALFRACYKFTDRGYLFLRRVGTDAVAVEFRKRTPDADLSRMVGEFANELIDQRLRALVADQTRNVRELIVAQAFAEARFSRSAGA
jgi:His-Xaa-Ser system protein HxsD